MLEHYQPKCITTPWWIMINSYEGGLIATTADGSFTTKSHNLQAFKTYVLNAIACNIKPHEVVIG